VYTEILREVPEPPRDEADPPKEEAETAKDAAQPELPKLQPMVLKALEATAREDGWATLSALGSQLTRNDPAFDSRNYGVAKLGELMRKQAYLEMKEVPVGEGGAHVQLHVRLRQAALSKVG
jgi:hypothetical protein